MAPVNEFAPQWTKIVARCWVDPDFKAQFFANPTQVMQTYGISRLAGVPTEDLVGRLMVSELNPSDGQSRTRFDGDRLHLAFPPAPREYDTVVDPEMLNVAGAGARYIETPGGAIMSEQTDSGALLTNAGQVGTGTKSHSPSSPPSLSVSLSSDDDDDDEDVYGEDGELEEESGDAGGEAAADAGADAAADAGADAAVDAGADAAADAAAAAFF